MQLSERSERQTSETAYSIGLSRQQGHVIRLRDDFPMSEKRQLVQNFFKMTAALTTHLNF